MNIQNTIDRVDIINIAFEQVYDSILFSNEVLYTDKKILRNLIRQAKRKSLTKLLEIQEKELS